MRNSVTVSTELNCGAKRAHQREILAKKINGLSLVIYLICLNMTIACLYHFRMELIHLRNDTLQICVLHFVFTASVDGFSSAA